MCLSCLNKKQTLIILIILIIASFIFENINKLNNLTGTNYQNKETKPTHFSITNYSISTLSAQIFKVKKVIDGDTILLENNQKVRYIGIDTPELHDPRKKIECFAKEAYLENKKLVEGKIVRLEKDVSETDKYNRLLRYVYLLEKDSSQSALFINEYLVKEGFAYAVSYPPDIKYTQIFLKAQKYAQENNKGLWKKCL